MTFYVLTLFPEMILGGVMHSVIKRAAQKGLIEINCVNIRDFSADKHKKTDDYPYGGGAGMLLTPEPIFNAYAYVKARSAPDARFIYLTPRGAVFCQKKAAELAKESELILLCGHYEGVDERVIESLAADEISLGDFVLSGGEICACAVIDAVSRLVPGVLSEKSRRSEESFSGEYLEYPQYTRPYCFMGKTVPDVLLSGDHERIKKWRRGRAKQITERKRPDLLRPSGL